MADEIRTTSVPAELEKLERRINFNRRMAWLFVALGFVAAAAGLWIFHADAKDASTLEKLSFVGSYFQGAVGSLWSLAGLLFIYVAFLGQKQQLLLQRQEMEGHEEQFRLQQEAIKRQDFENSFFQLLNLQNQLVTTLGSANRPGKEFFMDLHGGFGGHFDQWLKRKGVAAPQPGHLSDERSVVEFYEEFYRPHEGSLGPYFRNLYHTIKFVNLSEIQPKRRYTSLIRAQLSKFELFFLFYNCLSSYGKGTKPLIEEFGLLEHLDKSLLLHPSHENLYDAKAFK